MGRLIPDRLKPTNHGSQSGPLPGTSPSDVGAPRLSGSGRGRNRKDEQVSIATTRHDNHPCDGRQIIFTPGECDIRKRVGGIGLVFMVFAALGGVVAGPAAAFNPPPNIFHLVNGFGNCLSWVSTTNVLEQKQCNATDTAQLWHVQNEYNGYREIVNNHNGKCIAPAGGVQTNAELITYNCTGTHDELWLLSTAYWGQIRNYHSGRYMGIANGSAQLGAHAVQWSSYPSHLDQQWATLAP
ncbi:MULTISPECIES: RICIN domain-containing protein [unclassified Frankia]|uniref:RICIN domain-containing protein n=1 Tax=unclassified Frankia TaxID=2632575 RepID=UPI002AD55904|nr:MULTISPECIES: RICIN domain-containing protein [unclassified Frankia]